jgi:phosphate transport system permease protein
LGLILLDIFTKGVSVLSWKFLTEPPRSGMTEGGIFPAILEPDYRHLRSSFGHVCGHLSS